MEPYKLTIHQLQQLLRRREISSEEVTRSILARIKEKDSQFRAYLTVNEEQAIEQAKAADKLLARSDTPPALAGIPLAIKDNMCTKGIRTTCASHILENYRPPNESTVTRKLLEQGYVLLGKTNMDEFAMGSSTENSYFGPSRNPRDIERVPGGSSGGSAAAVAADECIAALGSDTGGSIRQPAALCGIVGLKPTYGLVSRYGLVAFASSLDQIGPLTKDVRDTAIMLQAIAGHDPKDSTSAPYPVPDYLAGLGEDIKGMKIGLPKEYFTGGLDADVASAMDNARKELEGLGAEFVEVSLPHSEYGIATYYIVATAEASSNLARYDGVKYGHRAAEFGNLLELYENTRREGFGPEVKRRIMLGTYVLSAGYYEAYYLKALKVRTLIRRDFEQAFKQVDLILAPSTPTPAFKFGEKTQDPLQMYLSDIFTITVNLAGIPAISIPCGLSAEGLPIGMQLMGPPFAESKLLKAAYAYEQKM